MNIKRLLPFTLAVTILASAVVSSGDTYSGTTKEIRFAGDTGDIAVEAEDGEKLNKTVKPTYDCDHGSVFSLCIVFGEAPLCNGCCQRIRTTPKGV